jgi:hypothetical protein
MYQPSNMASDNILAVFQEKIDYQLMQSENCVITRVREIRRNNYEWTIILGTQSQSRRRRPTKQEN